MANNSLYCYLPFVFYFERRSLANTGLDQGFYLIYDIEILLSVLLGIPILLIIFRKRYAFRDNCWAYATIFLIILGLLSQRDISSVADDSQDINQIQRLPLRGGHFCVRIVPDVNGEISVRLHCARQRKHRNEP